MEYEKVYRSLNCLVSVPPGDAPEGGWPVLIFLHGDGEAAPMKLQNAMKMHGPLRESSGTKATERFVVVAPQLPAHKRGDAWTTQAEAVRDIGLDVVGEHDCNAAQIYLTGFSFGGNGVLEIGVGQPNDWAALWPVDPTRPLQKSADRPIWVSGGPRARPSKETFRRCGRFKIGYLTQTRTQHAFTTRICVWTTSVRLSRPTPTTLSTLGF
jgi:predicted peptidase